MKSKLPPLFIIIYLLSCIQLTNAQDVREGISLSRLNHLTEFVQTEMNENRIPGASVLVARNGKVVYQEAFGLRDKANKLPMETSTLFYIQSMTKPIITTAFMMLYEQGHFELRDPVSKYLPKMKDLRVALDVSQGKDGGTAELTNEITIAHLLTHTAGLTHGLGGSQLDREFIQTVFMSPHETIADRVNVELDMPLVGQPGEQWYYSVAPDILSVLIEKFSGMPTDQYLKQQIFDPLGMDETYYNVPASETNRVVMNHGFDDAGALQVAENQPPNTGVTVWSGVNALYSTADDYFKFCQMLLNGGELNGKRLLSRKTVEVMTINHVGDLFPGPGEGFGYGFAVVTDLAATNQLGSEGIYYWSGAFNTHFFIDPKENIVAIFMSQRQPHDSYYHRKLRQLVSQALVD